METDIEEILNKEAAKKGHGSSKDKFRLAKERSLRSNTKKRRSATWFGLERLKVEKHFLMHPLTFSFG